MRNMLILIAMMVSAGAAFAQVSSIGSSIADPGTKSPAPRAGTVSSAPKSCPEFGPGFVRVEGSSSCVRIGGNTSVGVGGNAGR
jgi:hypothetical protein